MTAVAYTIRTANPAMLEETGILGSAAAARRRTHR
jgi:hypothetical protein